MYLHAALNAFSMLHFLQLIMSQVHLKCGEENKIISVKEPTTCNYELVFHTPLACPLDSLLGAYT